MPHAADRTIWTLRLWGLRRSGLDVALTVATVVALTATRFALLPSGPWEWDETLFARGILRFDLHAHFPHPPGFPLWMLLGWLAHFVVSEPLRGLQILSAIASILTLWPLASLGRRLAPAPVAATAAVAVLLAPGVWLHAVRGFSSTPAALFALWAAALVMGGLAGRRATGFTLLVTAAFLTRPILVAPFGLFWLAGAMTVRPRRRLVTGVALGLAATLLSVAVMVALQGSARRFVTAFATHARTHTANLVLNRGGVSDWGLVKGLGGPVACTALALLAALGLVGLARRRPRVATAWVVVLATGTTQIVLLQNRTFPRYAVPVQLALAPLAAGGAALAAPPALAAAGLGALGALWAAQGLPLLAEQHQRPMPGWDAVRFAVAEAQRTRSTLVVEPGLHPFLSYLEEVERSRGVRWTGPILLAPSSPDAEGLPVGRYLLVTDFPSRYLSPPFGRSWGFAGVSEALTPMTQRRFLHAAVVEGAPLPVRGFYFAEGSAGERFLWAGPQADLLLPPLPSGTALELDLQPAAGEAPLTVSCNGQVVAEVPGRAPRRAMWVNPSRLSPTNSNTLSFRRTEGYPPGVQDSRPLAVKLHGLRVLGNWQAWQGSVATGRERSAIRAALEGAWDPEPLFGDTRVWTHPRARLVVPADAGVLALEVAAPRPRPARLVVSAHGAVLAELARVPAAPTWLEIQVPEGVAGEDGLELTLEATPYRPADEGAGTDTRRLGIVLGGVRFTPRPPR